MTRFFRVVMAAGLLTVSQSNLVFAQNADVGTAVPEAASGAPVTIDGSRQAEYRGLLISLDQLVMQGNRDTPVYKSYIVVREQLLAGKLLFIVDAKSHNDNILQSAYFSPNAKAVSWIVADGLLLDRAKREPDLVLSLILNAMVFSDGFYTNPTDFQRIFKDPLESVLYSMDALFIQSLFIRDYLKPHYPKLSDYCRFLGDTLEFENMAGAAMFVLGVDQDIVYELRHMEASIRDHSLGPREYLQKVDAIVTEIDGKLSKALELGGTPIKGSTKDDTELRERTRYISVISTLTMLKYGVSIMNLQMPLFDKSLMETARKDLDIFNGRLDKLSEKVAPLMNGVMGYRKNLLSKMGI